MSASRDDKALVIMQALVIARGEEHSAKTLASSAYDLADALIAEGHKRNEDDRTLPQQSIAPPPRS